ncbi:unnamed protein product [Heligmosomoides polygyrus]|uniref:Neur_chan_memb domain-containing protein n=1 Tax=Heligmosomoides polygyrus TaxID=6339 RepID=A0A183GPP8_HELPZ|nr:unnamed protein product [Heligmosomoides polygyrus]
MSGNGSSRYGIETDTMTLQRYVLHEQRKHPSATGDLTNLLTSLMTAFKVSSPILVVVVFALFGTSSCTKPRCTKERRNARAIKLANN